MSLIGLEESHRQGAAISGREQRRTVGPLTFFSFPIGRTSVSAAYMPNSRILAEWPPSSSSSLFGNPSRPGSEVVLIGRKQKDEPFSLLSPPRVVKFLDPLWERVGLILERF